MIFLIIFAIEHLFTTFILILSTSNRCQCWNLQCLYPKLSQQWMLVVHLKHNSFTLTQHWSLNSCLLCTVCNAKMSATSLRLTMRGYASFVRRLTEADSKREASCQSNKMSKFSLAGITLFQRQSRSLIISSGHMDLLLRISLAATHIVSWNRSNDYCHAWGTSIVRTLLNSTQPYLSTISILEDFSCTIRVRVDGCSLHMMIVGINGNEITCTEIPCRCSRTFSFHTLICITKKARIIFLLLRFLFTSNTALPCLNHD